MKIKVLAIINPISGVLHRDNIPNKIEQILGKEDYEIKILFTEYAGHATTLAKWGTENKFDIVLAVGGDGTCNEIAKALIHTNTALGIIPTGSGNGLARHLGIPIGVSSALHALKLSKPVMIDYCKANDIPFFCTCGLGFDAEISKKFADSKIRGGATYLAKAVEEYFKYKGESYVIKSEGEEINEEAFIIACGNAAQYGNNAYIAPYASICDGKIDITIIKPFTIFEALPLTLLLFTKGLNFNPNIKHLSLSKFTIVRKNSASMHIDGEPIIMPNIVNIECVNKGLKVMIPATTKVDEFMLTLQSFIENTFGIKLPSQI